MANVSTLQQRQQEIHRPFQPYSETEGRVGRNIAAPQEQYAGGWAVAADAAEHIAGVTRTTISSTFNKEKDKLNPLAANAFAQAAFDFQKHLSNMSPEEREHYTKLAQEANQTSHEYLKGLYSQRAVDFLTEQGVSPIEQMYAKEKAFKTDVTGAKEYEQRQAAFDKATIDWAQSHNLAVINPRTGSVDMEATLEKMASVTEGIQALMNGEDWSLIKKLTDIDQAEWERMTDEQRKVKAPVIAEALYAKYVTPAIGIDFQVLSNKLKAGEISNYREAIVQVGMNLDDAIASVKMGVMPTETKEILVNRLTDFKNNTIKSMENLPEKSTQDLENAFKTARLKMKIAALNRDDIAGKFARGIEVYGEQFMSRVAEYWMVSNADAFGVGKNFDQALDNMDKRAFESLGNFVDNLVSIKRGNQPTSGSEESQKQAKAFMAQETRNYLQQTGDYTRPDGIIPEKETEVQKFLDVVVDGDLMLLQGIGNTQGKENTIVGDYIWVMSRKDYIPFLMRENQETLRKKYISVNADITDKYMLSPQVAGVLKDTGVNENRWISYDTTNKKFITGQADRWIPWIGPGLSGGTSNWTMNDVTESLNKTLAAKRNGAMLYLGRDLSDEEINSLVENMYNNMSKYGVNPAMFKPNNYTGSATKP